jgi:hypothetical protein
MFLRALALVAPFTMITAGTNAVAVGPVTVGSTTTVRSDLVVSGTFLPYREGSTPVTYDPHNEVWLDFTADTTGAASAESVQAWRFASGNPARSLVLHGQHTRTGEGEAGTAGPRVACLTLPDA